MRKGFTLIELMIVIAIIAIIAVMAVPDLLSKRRAANEANAMAALSTYSKEQETFRTQMYGAPYVIDAEGNVIVSSTADPVGNSNHIYADNFQNLYYGFIPVSASSARARGTTQLAMIMRQFANAPAVGPRAYKGATTLGTPGSVTEYNGYFFTEPFEFTTQTETVKDEDGNDVDRTYAINDFNKAYALVALPGQQGSSGDNMYWVGVRATLFSAPGQTGTARANIDVKTPSAATGVPANWLPR